MEIKKASKSKPKVKYMRYYDKVRVHIGRTTKIEYIPNPHDKDNPRKVEYVKVQYGNVIFETTKKQALNLKEYVKEQNRAKQTRTQYEQFKTHLKTQLKSRQFTDITKTGVLADSIAKETGIFDYIKTTQPKTNAQTLLDDFADKMSRISQLEVNDFYEDYRDKFTNMANWYEQFKRHGSRFGMGTNEKTGVLEDYTEEKLISILTELNSIADKYV